MAGAIIMYFVPWDKILITIPCRLDKIIVIISLRAAVTCTEINVIVISMILGQTL